jgi:ATP-dependent DNA helicase PIF1
MLLHNIVPKRGLCNGSQLIMTRLSDRVVETCILTNMHVGETTIVPRITLQPTMSEIPFKFIQRQFFVKVVFIMSINKSQG